MSARNYAFSGARDAIATVLWLAFGLYLLRIAPRLWGAK